MFGNNEQFLSRPKNIPEKNVKAEIDPEGAEYQKEFKEYFIDLFSKIGLDSKIFLEGQYLEKSLGSYLSLTRALSNYVNNPSPSYRLSLLSSRTNIDFDNLDNEKVAAIMRQSVNIELIESEISRANDTAQKNTLELLLAIVAPDRQNLDGKEVNIKESFKAPIVGACRKAEMHMLAFLSGMHEKQGIGQLNVILDEKSDPLFLEKIGIGNDYSCFSLKSVIYNKCKLPAGSLFSVDTKDKKPEKFKRSLGQLITREDQPLTGVSSLDDYNGFNFVRFSALTVPPAERSKVAHTFESYYKKNMILDINYDWVTPEIIKEFVSSYLEENRK